MVFLWDVRVGFGSYQHWALKADFVCLYHDPGIPSADTMQPFSFCQHTLPLGLAATMENSVKHGWICSLTSCEQQVSLGTAMYQMDGWIPPNTCGLFKRMNVKTGQKAQELGLLAHQQTWFRTAPKWINLENDLVLEAVRTQVADKKSMMEEMLTHERETELLSPARRQVQRQSSWCSIQELNPGSSLF